MLHTGLTAHAIDRLPSPKGVALALTKACRREDTNLQEIAKLLRTDPALSGRLLGLANAAALGGQQLASAEEAVVRLGLTRVSQVALAFSLIDQHGAGSCRNFNYAGFWNHALLMAATSQALGAPQRLGVAGDLFTVGLLAQIGRLALATAFPGPYSELIALNLAGPALLQREQALAQTDHLQLSVAMMEHWGVPIGYALPFGLYENPAPTLLAPGTLEARRAQLAHTAWQLARVLAIEGSEAALENAECQAALHWLPLERENLLQHLQEIESVWRVWLSLIARHA
jgi:hypothetical protein